MGTAGSSNAHHSDERAVTADAVALIEKHNNDGKRPQIEMWAESHLELLLARRPHLVSGFNLRS